MALETVDAWLEAPTLLRLTEADDYWPHLRSLIAALCRQHGLRELWSANRD